MKKLLTVALLGCSFAAYTDTPPPEKKEDPKDAKAKTKDGKSAEHEKHKKGDGANTGTTTPK